MTTMPALRATITQRRASHTLLLWLTAVSALAPAISALPLAAQTRLETLRQRRSGGEGARTAEGGPRRVSQEDTMRVGNRLRSYVVRAPRGVTRRSAPLPLVIALHGGGGNARNAEVMMRFTDLVERERLIVVYPNGTGNEERAAGRGRGVPAMYTWNARYCCAYAMQNDVDDVAFINALIDQLSRTLPVDPARIYATGMSNGAMMSHRFGRELSSRLAAIAPVVGAVFGGEALATSPVSAVIINGLLDASVPAAGGPPGGIGRNQWRGTPRPNEDQGRYWARANGCRDAPDRRDEGQIISWRWSCPPGVDVVLHQLRDGTHEWPGGPRGRRGVSPSSVSMDATAVIWEFFKAHPKRPS
jgi:polyhydroxybutyrate depolymerase